MREDTEATYKKFHAGMESENLLRASSFLDPRHKDLEFLSEPDKKATINYVMVQIVKAWAMVHIFEDGRDALRPMTKWK